MDDDEEIAAETRGFAWAGQILSFALLSFLRRKGVVTDEEAIQILDTTLMVLEQQQTQHPGDRSLQVARQVLGDMIQRLGRSPERRG